MRVFAVGVCAGVLGLAGCHSVAPTSILGADWNCLAPPPAFDSAGYVFQVRGDGTKSAGLDFTSIVDVGTTRFPGSIATRTYRLTAGEIARLLQVPAPENGAAGPLFTVTQTFGAAELSATSDDNAGRVASILYTRPDLSQDGPLYLVLGSILAGSITYDFDRSIDAALGGNLAARVAARPAASYSEGSGFRYSQILAVPQNVCIRPQLLPRPGAAAAPSSLGDSFLFRRVIPTPQVGVPLPHNI